jgi:hypothetical protein
VCHCRSEGRGSNIGGAAAAIRIFHPQLLTPSTGSNRIHPQQLSHLHSLELSLELFHFLFELNDLHLILLLFYRLDVPELHVLLH